MKRDGAPMRISAGVHAHQEAARSTKRAAPTSGAKPAPAGVTPAVGPRAPNATAAVPTQVAGARVKTPAAPGIAARGERDPARARHALAARLAQGGIRDAMVLEAIAAVPRHRFVDSALAAQAYEDTALPIGHEQTISAPSTVARMIAVLREGLAPEARLGKVLEIGTGCGYQAAVLSAVASEVYSIERIKPLYERAKSNLRDLRIPNLRLQYGDGMAGLPAAAPFDAIILAAAGMAVPQALIDQLAPGGRLIAPVAAARGGAQHLQFIEKNAVGKIHSTALEAVFFVPLKSGIV